jgi:hypothetical protein
VGAPAFSGVHDEVDEQTAVMRQPNGPIALSLDAEPPTERQGSAVIALRTKPANDRPAIPLMRVAEPAPPHRVIGTAYLQAPQPVVVPARGLGVGAALAMTLFTGFLGVALGFGLAKVDVVIAMLRPLPPVRTAASSVAAPLAETTLGVQVAAEPAPAYKVERSARIPTAPARVEAARGDSELERSFRVTP